MPRIGVLWALLFVACVAANYTVQWKQVDSEMLDARGYFPASDIVFLGAKNETGAIMTGGSDKAVIDCCVDSYAFFPNRASGRFVKLADIPVSGSKGLRGHMQVSMNGGRVVYIHGGEWTSGTKAHNEVYRFVVPTGDLNKGKWELVNSNGPYLAYHSAIAWDDQMVVFGGRPSVDEFGSYSNDLSVLDTKTFTWKQPTRHANWPSARASHAAAYLAPMPELNFPPSMFVIGGNNFDGCIADPAWQLNLQTMKWEAIDMPEEMSCVEDMTLFGTTILDPTMKKVVPVAILSAGWAYMQYFWNKDVFLYNPVSTAASQWTKLTLIGDAFPGNYRGMGFSFIQHIGQDSLVFASLAGCFQVPEQEYCEFDNPVWIATVKAISN
eukprot:TRINITY_DN8986_c0_g1_i1.p1 TRINITY_DN8986_c0_g1~~TRINITY_DN8986_c0_g1_i1.p1  ORF type:complete len:381 (+),score=69.42 TRINITY_DN8986_c0_g1_i1:76-1218(+)